MPYERAVERQNTGNIKLNNSVFETLTDLHKIASNKSKLIDEDITKGINLENSLCRLVYNLQLSSLPPKIVNFKMCGDT